MTDELKNNENEVLLSPRFIRERDRILRETRKGRRLIEKTVRTVGQHFSEDFYRLSRQRFLLGLGPLEPGEEQTENDILYILRSGKSSVYNLLHKMQKLVYQHTKTPMIDGLDHVHENRQIYENAPSFEMTVVLDADIAHFDKRAFIVNFAKIANIPPETIIIESVKAGSVIIDMVINTGVTNNNNNGKLTIEAIAERISTETARKSMVEFKIFEVQFGKPRTGGFAPSANAQRVIMNPRWNREYGKGQGQTHWDGALNDGKTRGGEPYYCPIGWKRFSVQFDETPVDFSGKYDDWPIAYHGTKFNFGLMISFSGLKASFGQKDFHGEGVYLSPSIKYCAHRRYAEAVQLNLSDARYSQWLKKDDNQQLFNKYNQKYVQLIFACRVKPGSFKKCHETMGLGHDGMFDKHYNKSEIEWVVPANGGEIVGPDRILIYGYMIKASDSVQTDYDPSLNEN